MSAVILWILLLFFAPLLPGTAAKTVAFLTGRRGPPLWQPYLDLIRLARKGVVYSEATTWVFRAAPTVWMLSAVAAASMVPLNGRSTMLHFSGDWALLAGLLTVGRFFLTLAALDTGSSFEGMGSSRELMIASFAEPVLFVVFATLAVATGGDSISQLFGSAMNETWVRLGPSAAMVALSLVLLLLAETARGPIDDPATHLELTMIHEVMILDHSGPDLAVMLYGSALRFALFAALLVNVAWPVDGLGPLFAGVRLIAGTMAIAVVVGIVESSLARLRLVRVPQYLFSAGVLAALGVLLELR